MATADDFARFRDPGASVPVAASGGSGVGRAVREFVTDLYEALRSGRLLDITNLYERGFRDLSRKFFVETPWPDTDEIAPLVNDDHVFLTLYKLLFYRHLLMRLPSAERPARMTEFAEAWDAYRELFDLVVVAAESANEASSSSSEGALRASSIVLPPSWVYDMLDEFLYHFQTFHERRIDLAKQTAAEEAEESEPEGSETGSVEETPAVANSKAVGGALEMDMDEEDASEVWRTEEVLRYLYRVVAATKVRDQLNESKKATAAARGASESSMLTAKAAAAAQGGKRFARSANVTGAFIPTTFTELSGYFALMMLLRLHTKLGDYGSALECASWIDLSAEAFFARVPKAHLTLYYYYGFSLLMSRRYADSVALFSRILLFFDRTAHLFSGEGSSGSHMSGYMRRQADKMLALLAVPLALAGYAGSGGKIDSRSLQLLPGIEEVVVHRVVKQQRENMAKIANASSITMPFGTLRKLARLVIPADTPAEEREKFVVDALTDVAVEFRGSLAAAALTLTDIFKQAAPGYIVPVVSAEVPADAHEISHRQKALFIEEALSRAVALPTLRSFMRLYTSLDTAQLADFLELPQETVRELILALKIKSWQRQGIALGAEGSGSAATRGGPRGDQLQDASHEKTEGSNKETEEKFNVDVVESFSGRNWFPFSSSELLHVYADGDLVHVEESKREADAAQFFARSVVEFSAMRRSVDQAAVDEKRRQERAAAPAAKPAAPRLATVKVATGRRGGPGGKTSAQQKPLQRGGGGGGAPRTGMTFAERVAAGGASSASAWR